MNPPRTSEDLLRQAKRMERLHAFVADNPLGRGGPAGADGYPERPRQISFTYADAAAVARMAAHFIAAESQGEVELAATREAQGIIALANRLLFRRAEPEPDSTHADQHP